MNRVVVATLCALGCLAVALAFANQVRPHALRAALCALRFARCALRAVLCALRFARRAFCFARGV